MHEKILLVAGEASGDMHGADLVREVLALRPDLEFYGIGGEHLRAAGMQTLVDTAEVATMGFTEVFASLSRLLGVFRRLTDFLAREKPALAILIDYPDFNLRLAKRAHRLGVPVFYYIGPQVWAWRAGRAATLARLCEKIALVFPFEPEFYNRGAATPRASFVGHPLLDRVRPTRDALATRQRYGIDPDKPLLAILPGSRRKEITHILRPALDAAARLQGEGWQSIVARAHTIRDDELREAAGGAIDIPIAGDDTYNVVAAADAVLVASGTATLETALLGKPMVIAYRVSNLSYAIGRALVRVPHIGMPNIILGRGVFPELLQDRVCADEMVRALHEVVGRRAEIEAALGDLRSRLGEPGAARRTAKMVIETLEAHGE